MTSDIDFLDKTIQAFPESAIIITFYNGDICLEVNKCRYISRTLAGCIENLKTFLAEVHLSNCLEKNKIK